MHHPAIAALYASQGKPVAEEAAVVYDCTEFATAHDWVEGKGERGGLIARSKSSGRILYGARARAALARSRRRGGGGSLFQKRSGFASDINRKPGLTASKATGVTRSRAKPAPTPTAKETVKKVLDETPNKPLSGKQIRTETVKDKKVTPTRGKPKAERRKEAAKPAAKKPEDMTREEFVASEFDRIKGHPSPGSLSGRAAYIRGEIDDRRPRDKIDHLLGLLYDETVGRGKQKPADKQASVTPAPAASKIEVGKMATYKGKQYLVKFVGQTKFGHKAKLAFRDSSKEFWVDADQVSAESPQAASRPRESGDSGRPASDKQQSAIRRMIQRVARVRDFDSISASGAAVARGIRKEIEDLGGIENLTAKQASDFISSLEATIDDEM